MDDRFDTDFGRRTAEKLDAKREPLANRLDDTASALHEKGESAASVAHATADQLESVAEYVREHDLQEMISDLEDLTRRYPARCLIAAVGIGFLLGRFLRGTD